MRLGELTIHGITRFKDPLVINFAELGPATIGIAGPNGCLHGDTPIHDPVDGTTRKVSERYRLGEAFHVWALGPHGPVIAAAMAPIKAPRTPMMRVVLEDGSAVVVTPDHRFRDEEGWTTARRLFERHTSHGLSLGAVPESGRSWGRSAVAESSPPLPPVLLASSSAVDLSTRAGGGLRWSRTAPGSLVDCREDLRSCGEPPPPVEGNAQEPLPSPDDALARTRKRLRTGDRSSSPGCSRPRQSNALRARTRFDSPGPHVSEVSLPQLGSRQRLDDCSTPLPERSLPGTRRPRSAEQPQLGVHTSTSAFPSSPPNGVIRNVTAVVAMKQVATIERVRPAVYFDFHVPVFNNYWACGMWHHNSGKSSILESSGPGALYRELPRKDAQAALGEWLNVAVPNPFLNLTFSAGEDEFEIEHRFAKATAILKMNGNPLTTGKMRDFDNQIEKLFGPSSAFYAGPFASQRSEGHFGALGVADRKALFRHYLDLGRLQSIHDAAAEKAKKNNVFPQDVKRRQDELVALASRAKTLDEELTAAQASVRQDVALLTLEQNRFDTINQSASLIVAVETYRKALQRVVDGQKNLDRLGPPPVVTQAVVDAAEAHWRDLMAADTETQRLQAVVDAAESRLTRTNEECERAYQASNRLDTVPCRGQGAYAACELLKSANQAKDGLRGLQDRAEKAAAVVADARRERDEAETPGKADIALARKELERLRQDLKKAQEHQQLQDALDSAKDQGRSLRKGLPSPLPTLPSTQDVKAAREALEGQRKALKASEAALAKLEAEKHHAEYRTRDLKTDLAEDAGKYRRLAGLDLIARAFGPHGLQALEIDAAGPTVAALANDLLDAAYGSRFTMEILTQRNLRSTKGVAEDFAVRVHDRKKGRSALLSGYSGGEQVILDEALRNAFSIFATGRTAAKYRIESSWRDESSSRLYEGNVARYTAMLSRARGLGNFHQVLFVGSAEEVEGADVVLHLREDGKIERTK